MNDIRRRTVIVEGPVAYAEYRTTAARGNEIGVQVLSIPLAAARLAGGFLRPVEPYELTGAVRAALESGGFATLESVRNLPGMARAVSSTLRRLWNSDFSLRTRRATGTRIGDLALIEQRIRQTLPKNALIPPDLRDAALQRLGFCATVLGPVELIQVPDVRPLWRPLLQGIAKLVDCTWYGAAHDVAWFPGQVESSRSAAHVDPTSRLESCANPKGEVIEALRWARHLVASGGARPGDIAICATTPSEWDAHMLTLSRAGTLPVFFSHGKPALASREGQICASLADVLLNGLNQSRVRRLLGYVSGEGGRLKKIPWDWWRGIEPGAALHSLDRWQKALDQATLSRTDGREIAQEVMACLDILNQGIQAADVAGQQLLPPAARILWDRALLQAGSNAIEYSLRQLRVPDEEDPNACIVWGPAKHIEAAPRPFVRLLGLTSRHWPRAALDDPVLPANLLASDGLELESSRDQDRRAFRLVTAGATSECVLSFSRRSAEGGVNAPSPLLVDLGKPLRRELAAIPNHAYSESDRLLARTDEARLHPAVVTAQACWSNWHESAVTPHDGLIRPNHPRIALALARRQSATSLRKLLRDPISFMWRYALGWRVVSRDEQPIDLDPRAFGEVVHEILKLAVDHVESQVGLAKASETEIAGALQVARAKLAESWPLRRETPPMLLWDHTLSYACTLALKALTGESSFLPNTHTWTEVAFGWEEPLDSKSAAPWDERQPVLVPATRFSIKGRIDRLELSLPKRQGARVTDYKSRPMPRKKSGQAIVGPGDALQRVIYAVAARQLLPDLRRLIPRLIYLADKQPVVKEVAADQVESEIEDFASRLNLADDVVTRGLTLMGPDPEGESRDFLIALPADLEDYTTIKRFAINRAFGSPFTKHWAHP
jgi:hypothetical protein